MIKSTAAAAAATLALCSWSAAWSGTAARAEPVAGPTPVQIDSGPVPMSIDPAQILTVRVKINGAETPAVVDTGSSDVLIDYRFANGQGMRTVRTALSGAAGGAIATGVIPDARLDVGRAAVTGVRMHVSDLAAVNDAQGTSYRAILGMSAMTGGPLTLDFRRMQLSIGGNPAPAGEGARSYPLSLRNGIPIVTMPLGNRTIKVAFDTGKNTDIDVSDAEFELLKPRGGAETSIARGGLGGITVARLSNVPVLDVGGHPVSNVAIEADRSGGLIERLGVDAIVGLRIIRRFDVTFDFDRHRAILAPSRNEPAAAEKSTSGLQLGYGDAFAQVMHVMAGSPAAAAGWAAGDRICRIDGNPISDVRASPRLKAWGTGAPGRKIVFTMCGGEKRALVLRAFY